MTTTDTRPIEIVEPPAPRYHDPAARPVVVLAWGLVALAMLLALLIVVQGLAGAIVAANPPEVPWEGGAGRRPDVIYPPVSDQPAPPSLERPCQPLFQLCEVTR